MIAAFSARYADLTAADFASGSAYALLYTVACAAVLVGLIHLLVPIYRTRLIQKRQAVSRG